MNMEDKIASISNPAVRHEFVLLFDVINGNPNGNPDAANAPRTDPETQLGFVTDVAIKRKVRDYLQLAYQTPMFIQSRVALNTLIEQAQGENKGENGAKASNKVANKDVRNTMMATYYDIRLFGAVLSTGKVNAGQVRGPVQVTFARSIDRVLPIDVTITRQARTTEERMETGSTEIGRKSIVPYGLYRAHGFFNPLLGRPREEGGTGVTTDDLKLFWEALINLFEFDRSASRGEMAVRGLYVFSHDSKLGNAPAHKLLERVWVKRNEDVGAARAFSDYAVTLDREGLPSGVALHVLTEG